VGRNQGPQSRLLAQATRRIKWSAPRSQGGAARWLVTPVAVAALLLAALSSACSPRYPPDRRVVSDVQDLRQSLATAQSPFWAKLSGGVLVDYEVFDETVLARDLERIERFYRARGYYEAKVTAARVIPTELDPEQSQDPRVRILVRVHEGDPVLTEGVTVTGIERLPLDPVGTAVFRGITLRENEPFDERDFEDTKEAIVEALADNGYAFVQVHSQAQVDLARHRARIRYEVKPGPRAVYGRVTIVGLNEIPERPVRAALLIEEGRLYSRADLKEAEQALKLLDVFSSVEVRQDVTRPESGRVPITVVVRESALRTVRLGVGARLDVLELSTHLRAGWEDRNFLGGMRRFSIDTRPGITYFPLRIGRPFERPTRLLPKNRLHAGLRQPAFLEGRTTGLLAGEYNVYPLLYPLPSGMEPEEERIIGYHELRTRTGLERSFFNFHLSALPSYNYRANYPFTYQGNIPEGLDTVRVAYPELELALDFRDDALSPHRGILLRNSVQVAGVPELGDVQDVRVQPEAYVFLPMSSRVTLALRGTVGFLFPRNYGESLDPVRRAGLSPDDPAVIRDQHKLLFRVFYSGGPGSNRGYPYRGVGPHGPLGFLVRSAERCSFDPEASNPRSCLRPLGGLTLWEASLEVRFPIIGPLRGATFLDASHVTREQARLRFDVPHLSSGFGVRYVTPVGPLRVDLGWHLVRTFVTDDPATPEDERALALEGEPELGPLLGVPWLPRAIHFAIGEAF
jgi:outer membrane protein assembly factor BamA